MTQEEYVSDAVDLLKKLIATPSVSRNEKDAADIMEQTIRKYEMCIRDSDTPDFIHNYRIVHDKDSNKIIKGLHFTFIELPKFTPHSIADKRMMVFGSVSSQK